MIRLRCLPLFVFIELTLKCVMNDKYNELSEQSEVRKSVSPLHSQPVHRKPHTLEPTPNDNRARCFAKTAYLGACTGLSM